LLFVGINLKDLENVVIRYVVENYLDGEEGRWEEEMWGFEETLSEKMFNEEMFSDIDETGIETIVKRNSDNFDFFIGLSLKESDVFFDSKGIEINKEKFEYNIKNNLIEYLSICEVSPTS
jgi:hypothetical protein